MYIDSRVIKKGPDSFVNQKSPFSLDNYISDYSGLKLKTTEGILPTGVPDTSVSIYKVKENLAMYRIKSYAYNNSTAALYGYREHSIVVENGSITYFSLLHTVHPNAALNIQTFNIDPDGTLNVVIRSYIYDINYKIVVEKL